MKDLPNSNSEFLNTPKAISSIEESSFLKLPFYRRKNKVDVIYINRKLYEKLFKKKYVYETAKKDIINKFSVTLKKSDEVLGYGYVDKQKDPTDISLNGNKGSGRAFYLYENCNIKGEKTPLATSPRDDYNNGKYSLDCAIQECLISNILKNTQGFDNFETLAVIDLNEDYLFPHTNERLPCGLIIRYYEKNELYRFSHRFVNEKKFCREELYSIAKKMGILEGNKFIKRFIHGAWSIGNLSIDVNMIDLDTSFFVKGRHPQWSFTDKYITNYFGFEQNGQLKVLETILNSKLNSDNVSLDELELLVNEYRNKTIRKEFASLIGYDEKIYNKYEKDLSELADEFSFLSQIIYDNYDNLNCLDDNCQNTYLFDFSNFFRYYEISKQSGNWSMIKGLNLLLNKDARSLEYLYDSNSYHEKIKAFFGNIIVDNEEKYVSFLNRAISFIEKFDLLNKLIDNNEKIDKDEKLVHAYIRNEDKKYLMARKWIRAELISLYKENGSENVNKIINTIIDFYSDQKNVNGKFLSDLYIFESGYIYRDIHTDGYNRFCLKMFSKQKSDKIIMNINNQDITLISKDHINYFSKSSSNLKLSEISDVSLNINDVTINTIELGLDNPKNRHIEYIFKENDDFEKELKTLLKDNYGINALSIDKVIGGTTKCYCAKDDRKKYFIKEFEYGKSIDSLFTELKILDILKNNGFSIANYIKTNNNKYCINFNGHFTIVQEFIDGKTYQNESLPRDLLISSASLLGEIHSVLKNEFSYNPLNNLWLHVDTSKEYAQIDYLLKRLESIKDDENYLLFKEILEYKKKMVTAVSGYIRLFEGVTMCMTHGDYSKRQLIFKKDNTPIAIDFSSPVVAPVVWEVIRSYFLSTLSCKDSKEFDFDLFTYYVKSYMKNFHLNENDLLAMPYTLLFQLVLGKYGYLEYIEKCNKEYMDFISHGYNICKFLEKNSDRISKKLIKLVV